MPKSDSFVNMITEYQQNEWPQTELHIPLNSAENVTAPSDSKIINKYETWHLQKKKCAIQ